MKFSIHHIFFLALLGTGLVTNGQVKVDKNEYDFGILKNWSESPAVFVLTNTSNSPMAILNIRKSMNVHVNYPREFIQPGKTARVFVYFEPPDIGKFNEDILVYTSSQEKPIKLVINGKVNSFQECPSALATQNMDNLRFELAGMVISSESNQPVPGATVRLINAQDFNTQKLKSGKDGKFDKTIPIGLYIVHVEAPGFALYEENMYLNKNTPFLEINLTPSGGEGTEWVANDSPETIENNNREKQPETETDLEPQKLKLNSFIQIGIVVDEAGNPVNRASVVLKSKQTRTPYFYKTMQDGKFRKMLLTGNYTLKVFAEGFATYDSEATLDGTLPELKITLTKLQPPETEPEVQVAVKTRSGPVVVAGTVLNRTTRVPVNRASLNFKNTETGTNYFYKTFKDGKFSKSLPPGTYSLKVNAPGMGQTDSTLTISNAVEDIAVYLPEENATETPTLQQGKVKLAIQVVDKKSGEPVTGAMVSLYNDNTDKLYMIKTNKNGLADDNLDTGLFAINLKAPGYQRYFGKLAVKPGMDMPVLQLESQTPVIAEVEHPVKKDSIVKKPVLEQVKKATVEEVKREPEILDEGPLSPKLYLANNIVFLVDVSGSMKQYHKIDNLKYSMKRLIKILRDIDMVTLITYSAQQQVVFSAMPADRKDSIRRMVDSMQAEGLTYGIRGLEKAYAIAEDNFIPGGNNEVIIATDGEFNSPDYSEIQLINMITKYARKDIRLTVIGFGKNEKALRTLKRMSVFGKGNYLHISNKAQAESILIEEIKLNSEIR